MKKFLKKLGKVLGVLVFELVFILGLGIYLIYYTEMFTTTRDMIVTTSMTTMTHQYFATWFLSDEKINEILAANRRINQTEELNLEKVDPTESKNQKGTEGVEVVNVSTDAFKAYLMIIDDPSRVDLVVGPNVPTVGSTTSQIVEAYDAVGGINAGGLANDTYGTGAMPTGLLLINGQYFDNEFDYGQSVSMCGFTQDNKLYVSDNITKSEIDQLNLRCAISFGPVLIVNGQPRISSGTGWGVNPRTCIGQRQDGTVLFLVIDGRQTDTLGATLKNAQDILLNYGAYNAFNLDGGASTTMVFNEELINSPSDFAGERYVPTAFIVK